METVLVAIGTALFVWVFACGWYKIEIDHVKAMSELDSEYQRRRVLSDRKFRIVQAENAIRCIDGPYPQHAKVWLEALIDASQD